MLETVIPCYNHKCYLRYVFCIKNSVKLFFPFGSVRNLRAGAGALLYTAFLLLPITHAHAANWQWSTVSGRDRLLIQLDGTEGESVLRRSGTHSLTLGLAAAPAQFSLSGAAPGVTSIVSHAQVRGNDIELALRNPAFGYMVTRPSPRQIVIDIFHDPLGARWTPSGQLAPAPPVVPAAAGAATAPAQAAAQTSKQAHEQAKSTNFANPKLPPTVPQNKASGAAHSAQGARGLALTPPSTVSVPPAADPTFVDASADSTHEAFLSEAATADDTALPEMPASGALRENPLPTSPIIDAPTAASEVTAELATMGKSSGKFLTDIIKGVLSLNAHASNDETSEGGRARILSPQNIRASVNSDGPEAWGTEDSLSTRLPVASSVAKPAPLPVTSPAASENGASATGLASGAMSSPVRAGDSKGAGKSSAKNEIRQSITPPGSGPVDMPRPLADAPARPAAVIGSTKPIAPVPPVATASQASGAVQPSTVSVPLNVGSPAAVASGQGKGAAAAPSPTQVSPQVSGQETAAKAGQTSGTALPSPTTAPIPAQAESPVQNMAETRQTATAPKNANATAVQGNATRPVVYVNEKGEIVPKPPEPEKMMAEAEGLLDKAQYAEALQILRELKELPLGTATHEKILYQIVDATTSLYAGKALEGFEPIVSAASEAMNANLRSSRVPDALFRLGMANLDVGNISEAEGYFKALKRRYPHDINVPVAFKNLGVAQLKAGKSAQAAQTLQVILQEYPETSVLQEASVALARALYASDDLDKMAVITDFIDKRWPRHYVQDQDYLLMLAESQSRMNRLESALQHYWLYYNLVPGNKNNDKVLANIGDLYLRTGRLSAAKELFEEILLRYPKSDGAALALLRLAEQGVHDSPITIEEMFRVFVLAKDPKPPVVYRELMRDYPKDPRAVAAGLKLAIWQLWSKEYTDAMGAAADFIDAYPEHTDVEQARLVIMRAFAQELKNSLAEENYGRILLLWNGFPIVRERYGDMDANMRHALARGYIERGDDEKALELLSEFLKKPKHNVYSDYAFTLFFNKYLQAADWNALLDLGELVKDWPMKPEMRSQLDYALALSAENLGLAEKALPLWQELAKRNDIPLYEQAYATYFLAKDAERRRDIKAAYAYNADTLKLFQRLQEERSDRADPDRIKESMGSLMDITEVGNHIPEALEWVERYNQFVPEDSPEYPGLRFREARLYRKLGDNTKAKALLEQIVKKAPDSAFGQAAAIELRTFEVSRDLQNFMQ